MLKRLLPGAVVAVALLGLAGPAVAQPSQPPRPPVNTAQPAGNAQATASSTPGEEAGNDAGEARQPAVPPAAQQGAPERLSQPDRQQGPQQAPEADKDAQQPPEVPYTGATPFPYSDNRPGAAFSTAALKSLRFSAPVKVGWGWPDKGVLLADDMTGNGHPDLLLFKAEGPSVMIVLYEGVGNGRVVKRGYVGQGWNQFDYVMAGDVNGDGRSDLVGRKRDGTLWYYASRGSQGFWGGQKIGWAWQSIRSITFVPGAGGRLPSLLATDRNGRLYRYPFANRSGRFADKITYAYGWNKINHIMPVGDWDGNGQGDFYAIDSTGRLYMYLSGPKGRTYSSYQVGQGWNVMSQIMAVTLNHGNGVFGINHSGELFYYPVTRILPRPPRPALPNWGNWIAPRNNIRLMTWSVVPQRYWNGTKVRVVRLALGRGAPLDASMTFDAGTEYAVKRFQRRAGLYPSGVVDMNTWNRLTNRSWWMDNWEYPPLVNQWASHDQRVEALIRGAQSFIGTPYTWGGAGPGIDGADCSGMALQAMYAAGIDPQPIQAVNDAHPTYRLSKALYAYPHLLHVPFGQRQRGDLIFWSGRYGIYHMAVYVGNNQVIESNYGFARQRPLYNWGRITPDVVRPVVY